MHGWRAGWQTLKRNKVYARNITTTSERPTTAILGIIWLGVAVSILPSFPKILCRRNQYIHTYIHLAWFNELLHVEGSIASHRITPEASSPPPPPTHHSTSPSTKQPRCYLPTSTSHMQGYLPIHRLLSYQTISGFNPTPKNRQVNKFPDHPSPRSNQNKSGENSPPGGCAGWWLDRGRIGGKREKLTFKVAACPAPPDTHYTTLLSQPLTKTSLLQLYNVIVLEAGQPGTGEKGVVELDWTSLLGCRPCGSVYRWVLIFLLFKRTLCKNGDLRM